jgi:hypothetical protein
MRPVAIIQRGWFAGARPPTSAARGRSAERRVGIALVDDVVEVLEHLPDRHPLAVEAEVLALLRLDEVERLVPVILSVELTHVAGRLGVVVAEVLRELAHGRSPCRSSYPRMSNIAVTDAPRRMNGRMIDPLPGGAL